MPKWIYISDDVLRAQEATKALWKRTLQKWKREMAAEAEKAETVTADNQRMLDRIRKATANLKLNGQVRARKKAEALEVIRQQVIGYRLRNPGRGSALEIANARAPQINKALEDAKLKPYKPSTIAAMIRREIDHGDG
jgi:hypothetical protein